MEKVKLLGSGIDLQLYDSITTNTTTTKTPKQTSLKRASSEPTEDTPANKIRKNSDAKEEPSISHQNDSVCKELPDILKTFIRKLPPQSTINQSNAIDIFYITASKARIHPDISFTEKKEPITDNPIKKGKKKKIVMATSWLCRLYIGDLLVCSSESLNKTEAKRKCFADAVTMLFNPNVCVKNVNYVVEDERKHTTELFIDLASNDLVADAKSATIKQSESDIDVKSKPSVTLLSKNSNTDKNGFGNFILVESSTHEVPITTIMSSAARNKVEAVIEISDSPVSHNKETGYLATLLLGDKVVARAVNQDKKAVKHAVAEAAVNLLKTCCYTIKTRFHEHENAQSNAVSMKEVNTEDEQKITSGIGMELLKKMGWSGEGGLGKKGQGRAEPVMVVEKSNRKGFGTSTIKQTDITSLKQMVKNFAIEGREDDLVFSSELNNEQRKVLHTTCRKFNLKSTSYGKDDDRYLIISPKRNIQQLAEYIEKNGGETLQYILIPPSKK
ncbi:uncharacterized protein [Antedon mediterranea]